jgi:acyl carrier protein
MDKTRESIVNFIIKTIKDQFCNDLIEVNEDTYLPSLGFDELDNVELTMELEYEYNFSIEDEDFENLRTVKAMADYVDSRLNNPTN